MKCRRCAGPMFPDEEGERFCLMCGERTYDWLGSFLDRLLEAMERQALKDLRRAGTWSAGHREMPRETRLLSPAAAGEAGATPKAQAG